VFDYRNAVPDTGASTVLRLGEKPIGARDRLLERLDAAARPSVSSAGAPRGAHRPFAVQTYTR